MQTSLKTMPGQVKEPFTRGYTFATPALATTLLARAQIVRRTPEACLGSPIKSELLFRCFSSLGVVPTDSGNISVEKRLSFAFAALMAMPFVPTIIFQKPLKTKLKMPNAQTTQV